MGFCIFHICTVAEIIQISAFVPARGSTEEAGLEIEGVREPPGDPQAHGVGLLPFRPSIFIPSMLILLIC
jgi:hypothetical protein